MSEQPKGDQPDFSPEEIAAMERALDSSPKQNPAADASYVQWQAEELQRFNSLAEMARKMGIVLPTGGGKPPPLNPDGSLKKEGPHEPVPKV